MKLVQTDKTPRIESEVETVALSSAHVEYLARVSRELNPDMPLAFGGAHVIRTLLERLEESGLDLGEASTEAEIARSGAAALRKQRLRG